MNLQAGETVKENPRSFWIAPSYSKQYIHFTVQRPFGQLASSDFYLTQCNILRFILMNKASQTTHILFEYSFIQFYWECDDIKLLRKVHSIIHNADSKLWVGAGWSAIALLVFRVPTA